MSHYHIQTSLEDFMCSISQEEYELRLYHYYDRRNTESLTDHYLMQLDMRIKQKFAKNPDAIKFEESRLVKKPSEPTKEETLEEKSMRFKAYTLACLRRTK